MTQTRTISIVQGDFAVSADPLAVMSTVLGSCVAVCLFDESAKIGGMNHFLLAGDDDTASTDLKYGVNAMELLINKLLRGGADRHRLRAKLFGGARMTRHARDIGASNAAFAQSFLDGEGLPCLSQSLGGTQARRVVFTPTTGAARMLQISGPAPEAKPPPAQPKTEAITLF